MGNGNKYTQTKEKNNKENREGRREVKQRGNNHTKQEATNKHYRAIPWATTTTTHPTPPAEARRGRAGFPPCHWRA